MIKGEGNEFKDVFVLLKLNSMKICEEENMIQYLIWSQQLNFSFENVSVPPY